MKPLNEPLTATVTVNASIEDVWNTWHNPEDIKVWNRPDDEWINTRVENDARTGGHFFFGMKKKDGLDGFDFAGTYTEVIPFRLIAYTTTDGRSSIVRFEPNEQSTTITEMFEPEPSVPADLQQAFCSAVLQKFRNHVESKR